MAAPRAAKKVAPGAKKTAKKATAKAKVNKICLHGCGQATKGGDFVIGHDAKLKSILMKAHVAGQETVDLGGTAKTPLHGQSPQAIASARGWMPFLAKAKTAADTKANKPKRQPRVKGAPVGVGDTVQFQYRGGKRVGSVVEITGQRARVEFVMNEGDPQVRAFGVESLTKTKSAAS